MQHYWCKNTKPAFQVWQNVQVSPGPGLQSLVPTQQCPDSANCETDDSLTLYSVDEQRIKLPFAKPSTASAAGHGLHVPIKQVINQQQSHLHSGCAGQVYLLQLSAHTVQPHTAASTNHSPYMAIVTVLSRVHIDTSKSTSPGFGLHVNKCFVNKTTIFHCVVNNFPNCTPLAVNNSTTMS